MLEVQEEIGDSVILIEVLGDKVGICVKGWGLQFTHFNQAEKLNIWGKKKENEKCR